MSRIVSLTLASVVCVVLFMGCEEGELEEKQKMVLTPEEG